MCEEVRKTLKLGMKKQNLNKRFEIIYENTLSLDIVCEKRSLSQDLEIVCAELYN